VLAEVGRLGGGGFSSSGLWPRDTSLGVDCPLAVVCLVAAPNRLFGCLAHLRSRLGHGGGEVDRAQQFVVTLLLEGELVLGFGVDCVCDRGRVEDIVPFGRRPLLSDMICRLTSRSSSMAPGN
jgi:hypothetical protein